ncbi:MAG: 4-hydroxybenzoyl-CoA reductase subunit beta [Myxococcota bacterium]|jgi:4-hydroxybenzoyl-CoA reductase subunit beta
MLRMDGFSYHHATSPAEAVALWQSLPDPRYIAGGTDLLPNIKHRIVNPASLIGVAAALSAGWEVVDGAVVIGGGTRLSALAACAELPALVLAAGLVASPQIRNMGTIGGNVLLDTRCLFYNQTEFWRKSLGYCLKAEGDWCHVIGGPKTCVAIQSSDTVPVLLVMDASITLLGPDGARTISLRDLYRFDGMNHLKLHPGELLTAISVPLPATGYRATYHKVRTRDSIDFPQLGLAIGGVFEGTGEGAVARSLDIVVGAINPQPKPIRKLEAFCDRPLTDDVIAELAQVVYKRSRPVAAVHGDPQWRRTMASVTTRRAMTELRDATSGS